MPRISYAQILGVSPDASQQEVSSAYRRLSKLVHPDIAGDQGQHLMSILTEAKNNFAHDSQGGDDQDDSDVPIPPVDDTLGEVIAAGVVASMSMLAEHHKNMVNLYVGKDNCVCADPITIVQGAIYDNDDYIITNGPKCIIFSHDFSFRWLLSMPLKSLIKLSNIVWLIHHWYMIIFRHVWCILRIKNEPNVWLSMLKFDLVMVMN